MNIQGKKISVVGLGKSGLQTALFLKERGAVPYVSEVLSTSAILARKALLEDQAIACDLGPQDSNKIADAAFVVISPGISPTTTIYKELVHLQCELISEIELGAWFCEGEIIAVTGTDGKTTVTTMIDGILREYGMDAVKCGNIGNPFVGELNRIHKETKVVLEVSSFQLYNTKRFHPNVAILLNIAPDHLDWHFNFKDYVDAKSKLFDNQTPQDYSILNFQDKETAGMLCKIRSQKLFFNQFPDELDANRQAAVSICDVYDLEKKKAYNFLQRFKGVEHRLETIPGDDGILYINDSKSTSTHSLTWALQHQEEPVILICGGRNKGLSFSEVKDIVVQKARRVVLFGEAAEEIYDSWHEEISCCKVRAIEDAVIAARNIAQKGDTILFSPACTSFDMFANYKERGKRFKTLVM